MSSLIEKFQQELEKGQTEHARYEQDIRLDARDPANAARITEAKKSHRKVSGVFALGGAAMIGLAYGFYLYAGDLYYVLGLLGGIGFVVGCYQMVVGKAVGKTI